MPTIQVIKQEFQLEGINEEHIDYAVSAIKEGTRRELIMENLIDQRGLDAFKSSELLDNLYQLNGGEFKVENRGGYVMGIFSLMGGLGLIAWSVFLFVNKIKLVGAIILGFSGAAMVLNGVIILVTALRGKYRDEMDPFKDEI